ncbi:MAG: 4-(cytidine 5'-diphospho)-2-C-methyl-D-erythritol kinase [Methylophilaceae bacterium]
MQEFQSYLAPAKINLFLHITGQRTDGYHTLQSVFLLLDYYDTIHLKPTKNRQIKRISDLENICAKEDLCVRAAQALQMATACSHGVEIAVEKRIPMGGGLGGGSSDAASVLLALNHLWQLNLSRKALIQIGLTLGADVPIFLFGQNAWAEGVGEILSPISLPEGLANSFYVVLTPQVRVSTAHIFANSTLTKDTKPLKIADFSRYGTYRDSDFGLFKNDLEKVVCEKFPAVASTLKWLSQFGQARMSGSGASVFVAVNSQNKAIEILAQKPENVAGFVAKNLHKHPLFELVQ